MGWQVEYTGKDGQRTLSAVFGSDTVAASYARAVKDGKVISSGVSAPPVTAKVVPDAATVDAARLSELNRVADRLEAQARERAAEAYAETGSQARLYGASVAGALDDARDQAGFAYRDVMAQGQPLDQACAMGCGRTVKRGFTTCRKCSRGL